MIIRLFEDLNKGQEKVLKEFYDLAEKLQKTKLVVKMENQSDDEEEEGSDEEKEDDSEKPEKKEIDETMDLEIEESQEKKYEKTEPVVDDDGFTLVQPKTKKKNI